MKTDHMIGKNLAPMIEVNQAINFPLALRTK